MSEAEEDLINSSLEFDNDEIDYDSFDEEMFNHPGLYEDD